MYHYWIEFWEEVEQKIDTEDGLVGGNSYSDAVDKLVKFYGKKSVFSVKLEEWEEILVKEDVIEGLTKTIQEGRE